MKDDKLWLNLQFTTTDFSPTKHRKGSYFEETKIIIKDNHNVVAIRLCGSDTHAHLDMFNDRLEEIIASLDKLNTICWNNNYTSRVTIVLA